MQTMGYKISRSDISKIENNKKFISDFEVLGFAKALKVSVNCLWKDLGRVQNFPFFTFPFAAGSFHKILQNCNIF